MLDLLWVSGLVLSAWGYGSRFKLREDQMHSRLARDLTEVAAGLAVLSVLLFALGHSWLLSRAGVLMLLVPGWTFAVLPLLRRNRQPVSQADSNHHKNGSRWGLAMALPAVLVAFAGTRVPEWFYDALYYQTAFPALYLLRGGIEVFPHAVHSAMPASVNVLFLPLLAVGSATTVKLAHFAFWLGCAAWLFLLARRHAGPAAGAAAATLFLALPGPAVMAALGAVDHGVTFFLLGAVYLMFPTVQGDLSRRELLIAGLLLGMAAAAKYTAVLPCSLAAAAAVLSGHGWSWPRMGRRAGLIALGLLITAGPWYLRNLLVLGNPVYPILAGAESPGGLAVANLRLDSGTAYSAAQLAGLPWDLMLERQGFGAGSELWPVGLVLAPALLWALWRGGFWRWSATAVVALTLFWSQGPLIARYLYPMIALTSAAAGAMLLSPGHQRLTRRAAMVAVAVLAVVGAGRSAMIQKRLFGEPLPILLRHEAGDEFLASRVQHAEAARWVRRHTDPSRTRLFLVGETAGYYFHRDYEPVSAYDRHPLAALLDSHDSGAAVAGNLKAAGFTHIIWNPGELRRLNQRSNHLPMQAEHTRVLRELLESCELLLETNGVSVLRLP